IQEFGFRLRYELVEKWCFLGRRSDDTGDVLSKRAQQLDHTITRAIGTNLLPSYPALVLLCLQQLEVANASDTTMGSFGHLYEALITANLAVGTARARASIDLDGKRRFLAHFAYELFSSKREHLVQAQWTDVFLRYCSQ